MRSLVSVCLITLFLTQKGHSQLLESPCGITTIPKIYGGSDADEKYAAFMAGIFNLTHYFQCGGTIIHKRFVLTAGHCLHNTYKLYVRLRARNINNEYIVHKVKNQILHPKYYFLNMENDIGLLQLWTSITYNVQVQPICIVLDPSFKRQVEDLKTFRAFGWGYKNGNLSETLQSIDLFQYPLSMCNDKLNVVLNSTTICAGNPNGDTCKGDSGGPLSTNVRSSSNQLFEVQLGIVSFGSTTCNGLGVYTDVTSHANWISSTINSYTTAPQDNVREETSNSIPLAQPPTAVAAQSIPERNYRLINPNVAQAVTLPSMLYNNCNQNIKVPIAQLSIYGPGFTTVGVLITDQLIITAATDLPEVAASLYVVLVGATRIEVIQIESVLKHPNFTNDYQNDIAALKLVGSITSTSEKPICILATANYQQMTENSSQIKILSKKSAVEFVPSIIERDLCSRYMGFKINENQICVEDPSDTSKPHQKRSYIMVAQMDVNGQKRYLLRGIFSFSYEAILVFTNVMRRTDWIRSLL